MAHWCASAVLGLSLFLSVSGAAAQTNSAIAGTVRDATGAVLPGVTVEAASPALIEGVRSTVTDATGQYRIIELRPGLYSVTFALPGFSSILREGIELTTSFTATVNAELRVGDVQETITVSGQTPIVDVQNIVRQQVITREVIDSAPTSRHFTSLGVLIPGATVQGLTAVGRSNDVGGSAGDSDQIMAIHGGRGGDQRVLVDGMSVTLTGQEAQSHFIFPHGSVEEINVQFSAHSAEAETGGMVFNTVPRSGGNVFKGYLYGSYTGKQLLSNNLNDDLRARGLSAPDAVDYISDFNPAFGGPLVKSRLWFYGGYRSWRVMRLTSIMYDTDPNDWVYTPDLNQGPVPYETPTWNAIGRVTWQASPRNKIGTNLGYSARCECMKTLGVSGTRTITYDASSKTQFPERLFQAIWTAPLTNRFLLEAGGTAALADSLDLPQPSAVGPAAVELSTGINFRAAAVLPNRTSYWRNYTGRVAASYVTGAHNFRAGMVVNPFGSMRQDISTLGDYQVNLLNGAPSTVTYLSTPYYNIAEQFKLALFAQDQWTIGRLTLNGGLRFDWLKTGYPAVDIPATRLLERRQFPGGDVLNWKDVSPRVGAAYDLFGTGKTAVKVSLGRYVGTNTLLALSISPANSAGGSLTRTWRDVNGDFVPQGDPLNPVANGELVGPSPNLNFGKPVITLRLDPEWASGWQKRDYNWEASTSVQHELIPRVSVSAGYFRRWYGNFSAIDNVAVAPTDFDSFCITAPSDSRLPGGGGQQICGLYDLNPSKVGLLDRIQTSASRFGERREYWQGADFTVDARLPNGVLLQGGLSTGRAVEDSCELASTLPESFISGSTVTPVGDCHREQPLLTNVKFLGSYVLPWSVQVAATLQSIGGIHPGSPAYGLEALYVARSSEIAPSFGRHLSSGANGTATVNVIPPGSVGLDGLDHFNQIDVRVARSFRVRTTAIKGMVDLYNVTNANPVVRQNYNYGTNGQSWLVPQNILLGRLVTFGFQVDF